ncbi:hypothetical protein V8E36_008833, partial [Tilletia maclaganii]
EVVVEILAELDPATLTRCTAVSKGWKEVVEDELVWRRVALRILPLPADIDADELATLPAVQRWSASNHFRDVQSFRQLCVRWQQIVHGWRGKLEANEQQNPGLLNPDAGGSSAAEATRPRPTQVRRLQATHNLLQIIQPEGERDIWRIKLDPEEGVMICTSRSGGLYIVDINTNRVIWKLGIELIGPYQHLEGERGILVVGSNRLGTFVWAHKRLIPQGGGGELYQLLSGLSGPQRARASRFKWPVFCSIGSLGNVQFWDLTDPARPQALTSLDASSRHGFHREISYIDFDDQHLFLVGQFIDQVTVYDRTTGRVKWSMAAYLRQPDVSSLIRNFEIDVSDLDLPARTSFRDTFAMFEARLKAKPLSTHITEAIANLGMAAAHDSRLEWVAIYPDDTTGALFILGRRMLVIVPNFTHLTEASCRTPIATIEYRTDLWPETGANRGAYFDTLSQIPLNVLDGRAFIAEASPAHNILLDLVPDWEAMLEPGSAPLTLPADPAASLLLRVFVGLNPHFGCSCVHMDAANIFAVVPTMAPTYNDDADEDEDEREAYFETLHLRIGHLGW